LQLAHLILSNFSSGNGIPRLSVVCYATRT
jgi:hypothetical protein